MFPYNPQTTCQKRRYIILINFETPSKIPNQLETSNVDKSKAVCDFATTMVVILKRLHSTLIQLILN